MIKLCMARSDANNAAGMAKLKLGIRLVRSESNDGEGNKVAVLEPVETKSANEKVGVRAA
jgi:hypothetical protein